MTLMMNENGLNSVEMVLPDERILWGWNIGEYHPIDFVRDYVNHLGFFPVGFVLSEGEYEKTISFVEDLDLYGKPDLDSRLRIYGIECVPGITNENSNWIAPFLSDSHWLRYLERYD